MIQYASRAQLKEKARDQMAGHYGNAILLSICRSLIVFIVDFHRSLSDRHHIILSEYCLQQTCCNCQSVLRLQILIQKIARDLRSTDPAEYGMYTSV